MNNDLELLGALQRFETKIMIDASGADSDIFERVLLKDPKTSYYLASAYISSVYSRGQKLAFDIEYKNTDVSRKDIYIVSTGEDVQNLLCQYIGDYRSRLVFLTKSTVNIDVEYQKFKTVHAPFYSNYRKAYILYGQLLGSQMTYYDFSFDYRIGKVKLSMMEIEVDNEVERLAKQMFLPGMSDETKALLAHNYLAYTIDYTLKEDANNLERSYMQSAYGALIKKKCVCQGYAEAFKRLMDYADIPCDVVCGQNKGSSTYHAWNILKLNGERDNYHIDVTWDSDDGKISHTYFGLNDSEFDGKRTWNKEFNAKCDSSKNLLLEARKDIMRFKSQLILNGVDINILR